MYTLGIYWCNVQLVVKGPANPQVLLRCCENAGRKALHMQKSEANRHQP